MNVSQQSIERVRQGRAALVLVRACKESTAGRHRLFPPARPPTLRPALPPRARPARSREYRAPRPAAPPSPRTASSGRPPRKAAAALSRAAQRHRSQIWQYRPPRCVRGRVAPDRARRKPGGRRGASIVQRTHHWAGACLHASTRRDVARRSPRRELGRGGLVSSRRQLSGATRCALTSRRSHPDEA